MGGMMKDEQMCTYTPTLWEWLVPPVPAYLAAAAALILSDIIRDTPLPTWPVWALLGSTAGAWAVAWWQQEQRPWLSELAGLGAASCWCLGAMWLNTAYQLQSDDGILLTAFFGLVWVPWVLRQRVVLGVVMMQSLFLAAVLVSKQLRILPPGGEQNIPDIINPAVWLELLPMLVAYGWWMLAERLRRCKGRYAGYSWVGMPACFICQVCVIFGTMDNIPRVEPLILAPGMAAIALLLRPCVAWRRWLVAVAAAVLPIVVCQLADAPQMARSAAALLFPVAMLWLAVVQRRREWVVGSILALLVFSFSILERTSIPTSDFPLLERMSLLLFLPLGIFLYRKACTPAPHHD